ncbi:MAG TPA: sorbosone dehydrogenase family protein [Polyangiales bacterium]|nr:sorbosone dehydrogenase family protein [Polyangiales bacterium]
MQLRSGIVCVGLVGLAISCSSSNQHGKVPSAQRIEPAPAPPPAEPPPSAAGKAADETLRGQAALSDWTGDAPGVRRKLTLEDLPLPHATKSVKNQPDEVDPKEGALPKVPAGFQVARFVTNLKAPRMLRTAPNGDIFVAESKSDRVRVLRDADGDGRAEQNEVFADGLKQPFGIAFYPPGDAPTHVYIANTDSVVRFPYRSGATKAGAKPQKLIDLSGGGQLEGGGHWTRDVAFSSDGKKLYVSVGSKSNNSDDEGEARRARIFEYTPDGKNERVFAYGIRNPVGLAVHPETGQLWASVNERDELGDHLVPDYITHVTEGAFYGWPWFYLGDHPDPEHVGKHPELKGKVTVPDVLVQSHSASLGMTFYTGKQFPSEYRGQAFAALHGSWNRNQRTGYKVIRLPIQDGKASGEYIDFMTGLVTEEGKVWGRPVAVTTASDGALLVSDDVADCIWRVSYKGE